MFTSSTVVHSRITVGVVTFLLAALAAASVVFWVLQWPARTSATLYAIAAAPTAEIDSDKVAGLLGGGKLPNPGSAPTALASIQYKLLGVIAAGEMGQQGPRGSALIAVADEVAKPFKVGDVVADDLVLQSVRPRSAILGPVGRTSGLITLELPLLPTANLGAN